MLTLAFRLENMTDASSSALAQKLRYQLIEYYRESVYFLLFRSMCVEIEIRQLIQPIILLILQSCKS
jgi:hypothetical protein